MRQTHIPTSENIKLRIRRNQHALRAVSQRTPPPMLLPLLRACSFRLVNVKCGQRRIFLSQLAILAPISGALPHLSLERRAHPLRFGPSHLPRFPLKDGDEFVRPDVTFVLGPFLLGELIFGRFGGQIIDPSLKLRVRPIIQDGFGFVRQNDSQNRANPAVERSAFWCRYHSRTIPNTIHFRKLKKKLQ